MNKMSDRTAKILHWSLLGVAGALIVFQLIQMFTGQEVNQVIAWAVIIIVLVDLAFTRMRSRTTKKAEDDE